MFKKVKLPGVIYEMTTLCNLKCKYCYNHWKKENDNTADVEKYNPKKTLKQFNANKIIKPIEELVTEHNMIFEDDRVYLSEFHYKKHQNYLNYINKINDVNLSESTSNFKR